MYKPPVNGYMFTCQRCRVEKFEPFDDSESVKAMPDGWMAIRVYCNENMNPVYEYFCDKCNKKHNSLVLQFMDMNCEGC